MGYSIEKPVPGVWVIGGDRGELKILCRHVFFLEFRRQSQVPIVGEVSETIDKSFSPRNKAKGFSGYFINSGPEFRSGGVFFSGKSPENFGIEVALEEGG
jgi:hypothetical protein